MARARTKNAPFDFDSAAPGQTGPGTAPRSSTPSSPTAASRGSRPDRRRALRTFTIPLAAVRRQPVSRARRREYPVNTECNAVRRRQSARCLLAIKMKRTLLFMDQNESIAYCCMVM